MSFVASGVRRPAMFSALAAIVVFLPSAWNGFAYDDVSVIVEHAALHDLANLPHLLTSPYWPVSTGLDLGLWRPVTTAGFAVLWQVGSGSAWIFHTVNIALHGLVAALVAVLAARMIGPSAAWIAGLVFAVHPVHVEAVANSVGFAELLSAAIVLVALLLVLAVPAERSISLRRAALVALLYGTAMLTKEASAILPGLLVVLEWWRDRTTVGDLRDWSVRRGRLFVMLAAVLLVTLLLRSAVLGAALAASAPLGAEWLAIAPRIWTMAAVWLEYLRLLVFPFTLSPDYAPDVVPIRTGWDITATLGVATVLAGLGLAAVAWRRTSWGHALAGGMLWVCMALLPVSNLLFLSGVLLAERTLYLPSVGLALALAGLLAAASTPEESARRVRWGVLALCIAFTARSVTYIPVWRSHASVFNYMLETRPESLRSRWVTADLLVAQGRTDEALSAYRSLVPRLGETYYFLTRSAGRLESVNVDYARAFYRRAWASDSTRVAAPRGLSMLAARSGDWTESAAWAERAIHADDSVIAWHLYATALARLERWGDAASAREQLLQRGERGAWQQWTMLAESRARAGDARGALAALDSARLRAPTDEALQSASQLVDSLTGAAPGR